MLLTSQAALDPVTCPAFSTLPMSRFVPVASLAGLSLLNHGFNILFMRIGIAMLQ